ncbi:MAG: hypothetical protein JXB49_02315, partial [Bacteroidales bacterium]|nr:hypothetical protein [Bacteroidales bacterium]
MRFFKTIFLIFVLGIQCLWASVQFTSGTDHRFIIEDSDVVRKWGEFSIILTESTDTLFPGTYTIRDTTSLIKWDISKTSITGPIGNLSRQYNNQYISFVISDTLSKNDFDTIKIENILIYNQVSITPSIKKMQLYSDNGYIGDDIYSYWIGEPLIRFDNILNIHSNNTEENKVSIDNFYFANGKIDNAIQTNDTLRIKLSSTGAIWDNISFTENAYLQYLSKSESVALFKVKQNFDSNDSILISGLSIHFVNNEQAPISLIASILPKVEENYIYSIVSQNTLACGNPSVDLSRSYNYIVGDRTGKTSAELTIT